MQKNVASQTAFFFAFDSTTGLPKVSDGANILVYVSKDAGTVTLIAAASGVPTEVDSTNAKGYYKIALAQGETNGDVLLFSGKSSTSNIVVVGAPARVATVPPNFNLTSIDGSGRFDLGKILGTASQGAAGYAAIDAAQAISTTQTAGTVGEALLMMINRVGSRGTAQAGTSTTITLNSGASATDNIYNTHSIKIIGGTGAGQIATIASYVGSTKVATITRPGGGTWTTNPDNTSIFQIEAVPLAAVGFMLFTLLTETTGQLAAAFKKFFNISAPAATMDHGVLVDTVTTTTTATTATNLTNAPTAGDFTAAMKTSLNAATPASVVGAVGSVATGGITSASFGANAINAAAIADGAIDRATFAADTGLQSIRSNTAQAGASTSITLDSGANASNSFYVNCLIVLTGGTGAGQARFITAYVGATKVASVSAWVTNPDSSTTFAVIAFDSVPGATAPTTAQITAAIFTDLMAGTDFNTASSFGALIKANIDAAISSRTKPADTQARVTLVDTVTTNTDMISQANVRTAVGLASANLDTQIAGVQTDTTNLKTRVPAALTANGNIKSSLFEIITTALSEGATGRIAAAWNAFWNVTSPVATAQGVNQTGDCFPFADRVVARGTIGSASTTTSLVTSALTPAGSRIDQFKGRIVIFDRTTTTANLRGQATDITGSTGAALAVFTVTALTDAPSSGDTFSIV